MTRKAQFAVVGAAVAVLAVAALSRRPGTSAASERPLTVAGEAKLTNVPRLIDLGAGKCIPCKAMAPILDRLRADYAGRMQVEIIDVWENPAAAERYGINIIPTQIFYAGDGRELSRHEGFMSREEIMGRWKTLGVRLD